MTKLAPEWVRTSDPVIRSPARYRWTTAPASVSEEDAASPDPSADSAEGCFSCGGLTHTTDQCRTLDESFPFLPTGWQAEQIGDQFILGPGPPARPQGQQMGNAD